MKIYKAALLVSFIPGSAMAVKLSDTPSFEEDFILGSLQHEKLYLRWLEKQRILPTDLKEYPEVEDAWTEYRKSQNTVHNTYVYSDATNEVV